MKPQKVICTFSNRSRGWIRRTGRSSTGPTTENLLISGAAQLGNFCSQRCPATQAAGSHQSDGDWRLCAMRQRAMVFSPPRLPLNELTCGLVLPLVTAIVTDSCSCAAWPIVDQNETARLQLRLKCASPQQPSGGACTLASAACCTACRQRPEVFSKIAWHGLTSSWLSCVGIWCRRHIMVG